MDAKKARLEFGVTRVIIPGITQDARTLGVNRTHLFRVLKGERKSKSLLRRYRQLKGYNSEMIIAEATALLKKAEELAASGK